MPSIPRLYRRAIVIYITAIAAPAFGLLWLGIQSFERQRQALATLTAEKIEAGLESRTRAAAQLAFADRAHPIATHFFTIDRGTVVEPPLHAPDRTRGIRRGGAPGAHARSIRPGACVVARRTCRSGERAG